MPFDPSDPIDVKVYTAVVDRVVTLSAGMIVASRVYQRPTLTYSTDRDGCPAVVVAPTPNIAIDRKRKLSGSVRDLIYPVSVVLFAASNRDVGTTDPKPPGTQTGSWRSKLRDIFERDFYRKPHPSHTWPAELIRFTASPEAFIDVSAWESAGLWVATVSFRAFCRTTT